MRSLGLTIAVVLPASAFAQPRIATMVHLPERLEPSRAQIVEQALSRALSGLRADVAVLPEQTFSLLARDPRGKAARRRATDLLADAIVLVDRLRYPEAVEALEAARANAVTGLAQLVEPKLLADIDFHLGVVRHVMQDPRARAQLDHSFVLFPGRVINAHGKSPKVVQAAQDAARRARRSRPRLPSLEELRRAARLIQADRIVLVTPLEQSPALEVVDVRVFHAGQWAGGRRQVWAAGASVEEVASRLSRALGDLVGEQRPVVAQRSSGGSRLYAWIATGLATALAGAGTGLFVVSHRRIGEAESLATTPPSAEYSDRAQGLEDSARRLRTGAIVTLSLAGAAAVGAVVLWLTSRPTDHAEERRIAPLGTGVLVRF